MKKYILAFVGVIGAQASTTLSINEGQRIEAVICADSMNRLTVANDRITQIFGDEGTFESQHDEATGQIFLKPTAENGTKNLSLTLITEQGLTQDLTLKPLSNVAKTVILKGRKTVEEAGITDKNSPYQDQLLMVLKQSVRGQLLIKEGAEPPICPEVEGFQVTYDCTFHAGSYEVHVFDLENMTEMSIEIDEKKFYQSGNRALSVLKSILPKAGKTKLYTVNRS